MIRFLLFSNFFLSLSLNPLYAERIKDIASVVGIRSNQLVGYGLVVGLDGSGDSSASFTDDSMRNMLEQLGISLPPGAKLPIKNVAAVSLSVSLPPFVKADQKIDVNISSIGNSKSWFCRKITKGRNSVILSIKFHEQEPLSMKSCFNTRSVLLITSPTLHTVVVQNADMLITC